MKRKAVYGVMVTALLLVMGSRAFAGEVEHFDPKTDTVEYVIEEMKMITPGEKMSITVRNVKSKEIAAGVTWKALGKDFENGFVVFGVPGNTLLRVGENIEVVDADPKFSKPENPKKQSTPRGDGKDHLEIDKGESVFFAKHTESQVFTVYFAPLN
jgi:hypothetical protein